MMKFSTHSKWVLPMAFILAVTLFFSALPVYAAEERLINEEGNAGETEASVSFIAGDIKLMEVPVMDFGSHDISHEEQAYPLEGENAVIQVSDLRGTGKGWDLMASLTSFQLEGQTGSTLQAAGIQVNNPTVSAVNGNLSTPPSAVSNLFLESDNLETRVWEAGEGEGMGVWNLIWNKNDTKLIVKAGTAQEGKSVATINWSLQSTP